MTRTDGSFFGMLSQALPSFFSRKKEERRKKEEMGKKYSVFFFELKNSTLPLAGGAVFLFGIDFFPL